MRILCQSLRIGSVLCYLLKESKFIFDCFTKIPWKANAAQKYECSFIFFWTHCGDPTGYLYVLQPSFYSGWKGVKTRFFVQVKSKLMGLIEYKQKHTDAFFLPKIQLCPWKWIKFRFRFQLRLRFVFCPFKLWNDI